MKNETIQNGKYVANIDMPIKYTYQLGGGINGRTIKKGEEVTVIARMPDINSASIATIETLYRINDKFFAENFSKKN